MLGFADVSEGTEVVRISDSKRGFIEEIRERRPMMAKVRWSDGVEQWMHPEQIRLPDCLQPPPPSQLTTWNRTTPEYLVGLRRKLWKESSPRPHKPNLEKEADKLVGMRRKKAKKASEDFSKREFKYRKWVEERIARDKDRRQS